MKNIAQIIQNESENCIIVNFLPVELEVINFRSMLYDLKNIIKDTPPSFLILNLINSRLLTAEYRIALREWMSDNESLLISNVKCILFVCENKLLQLKLLGNFLNSNPPVPFQIENSIEKALQTIGAHNSIQSDRSKLIYSEKYNR